MIGRRKVKLYTILLAATMLTSSFIGCTKKDSPADSGNSTSATTQDTKKIEKPKTLKYWTPVHVSSVKVIKDFSENEVYKEKMKKTGINIEFIHPAMGQEKEQFQLMIASNDLPDIIQHNGQSYTGGPDKGIKDGIYLKLNDLVDKYAPNYKKLRESNKEVEKLTITDEGNIWAFLTINGVQETAWRGPVIRKDLLDKANLPVPSTIDEWYTALKAFKNMGIESPLLFPKSGLTPESQFAGAFGIANEWYQEGGKVKYGPLEPGYKEYLATISKWYGEGLIDKDFATRNQSALDALVTSNKAGAWIGAPDTGVNPYVLAKKGDPAFALVGAPYPTLKKGDKLKIGQKVWAAGGNEAAITTACKYPEAAVEFMDFNYSQEGSLLFNYGIEGQSYKMVNNKPAFTDLMLNNPDKIDFYTLAWKYKLHTGPYLRDYTAAPPYSATEKQVREAWSTVGNENMMPPVSHTTDENKKISSISSDLNTYKSEMIMKFILGVEPMTKYDEFVKQLKSRGIDELIAIKQTALDRYNKK